VIIVAAVLIIAVIAGIELYLQLRVPAITPTTTVEINMTAEQFRYDPVIIRGHEGVQATSEPLSGQFANTTITVYKGDKVILHLTALDVPHGFALSEYNIFVSIPVGATVDVEFVVNQAGRFMFYCTVFCGTGHPKHMGTLIVK